MLWSNFCFQTVGHTHLSPGVGGGVLNVTTAKKKTKISNTMIVILEKILNMVDQRMFLNVEQMQLVYHM